MNTEAAQRYRLVCDDDGHDYLIPAEKEEAFKAWLEHESKMWDEPYSDEEFEKLKNEYQGEDFNDYKIGSDPSSYTFTDPLEDK